jgi:tRNA pseudouridine38-40 synthase
MAYRYFIHIAYNGSAYGGWQIQPNASTVQEVIDTGLAAISGFKGSVTGCGRTDAGVSASTFYAHFDHEESLSGDSLFQLAFRLNRFLPQDIVVYDIKPVLPGTHARFNAKWREYEYLIIRQKDPFNFHQAYFVHGDLDIEKMNICLAMLLGRHDFQCFSKVNTQVNNYLCVIDDIKWTEKDHFLKFTIRADRFLRNMVRAIVGTMLDVGRGKISFEEFQQIINSHDRRKAGYSVPAKGLTLTGIGYPEGIFSEKPVFFSPESSEKIISHYYTDPRFHNGTGYEINEV